MFQSGIYHLQTYLEQMLLETTLTVAILLVTYGYYRLYLVPKRIIKEYVRVCQSKGLKVYAPPISFLGMPFLTQALSDQKQHKDLMHFHKHSLVGYDLAVVNSLWSVQLDFYSPKLIKEVNAIDKAPLLEKDSIFVRLFMYLTHDGLLTTEGQKWKGHRKIISKTFNHDFVTSQIPTIHRICKKTFDFHEKLSKVYGKEENQFEVSLELMFSRVTSLVVLSSFLGLQQLGKGEKGEDMEQIVRDLIYGIFKMGVKDPLILIGGGDIIEWGLKQSHREYAAKTKCFRNFARRQLNKIKDKIQSDSLQSSTMFEKIVLNNKTAPPEEQYTEEQFLDELMTFIIAGTDSTSNLLTFLAMEVGKNPRIMQRIRQEIVQNIPSDEDMTYQNLKKMRYLEWTIKEVSRMFNPTAAGIFERRVPHDMMFGDLPVSKDTVISFGIFPTFYDPKYFESPHEFRPERWEHSTQEQEDLLSLAFGGGPRTCIGKQLAYLEAKVTFIEFMKRYKDIKEVNQRVISALFTYSIDNPVAKLTKA